VLAVYNWPAGTERYRKVTRFVQAFFYRPHDLQGPPYHAKWRAIDVTAPVLGWTRFAAAQDWIKKAGLDSNGPTRHARADEGGGKREAVAMSPQERNALFTQFDAYRKRQTAQLDSTGLLDARQRDALFAEFLAYQKQQTRNLNSAGLPDARQPGAGFAVSVN
jgi:hypothetical protein